MTRKWLGLGSALALLSVGNAQAAEICMTPEDIRGLVGYILPTVAGNVTDACGPLLGDEGYLARKGPGLVEALRTGQDTYWPAAKSAFMKFGNADKDKGQTAVAFAELPDDVLQPLVDQIFMSKFDIDLSAEKCRDVEDILEALAPLSPEGSIHLVSVILAITVRKDKEIPSCPRQP